MRRWPAVLGVLAAGGCALPSPPPSPPLAYPPAAAERVLRIALAEWREWGRLVQEADRPAPATGPEAEPANFPRILAYWRAVPQDHGAIGDNRRRYAEVLAGEAGPGPALWAQPYWSAAFISWVFATAGVDAPEFPPSATHALYLDGLIATARAWPDRAPFIPHAPEDRAPAPGDLVCRDRSPAPLRHWTDRLAETGTIRPMHCDIVVRTAREDGVRTARDASEGGMRMAGADGLATAPGTVDAVGGNVLDAVAVTRFPADDTGRLLPSPPGRAPVVLIMESRLGRLPPWSTR